MVKSMTGYGNLSAEMDNLAVTIEIKSLNSKFLDLSLKLSKEFADKELEIRNILNSTIERGKVSLSIDVKSKTEIKPKVKFNKELVNYYYKELTQLADFSGAPKDDLFRTALTLPGATDSDISNNENDVEWTFVSNALKEAIKKCEQFRLDEGRILAEKFLEYLAKIESLLNTVIEADPKRIAGIRERITNHITEYTGTDFDRSRFEQEMIYYIEKLDINEEYVRLKSHLDYFRETMNVEENSGKKLGFIGQEIGREINTIGSKCNDAIIQRCIVQMKDELEKIKEQVLNIL